MVANICMFVSVVIGSCCDVQSLWLTINMVTVCSSSLAATLVHWMASRVMLCSVAYARPIPFHMEDFAWSNESNIMSRL